MDVFAFCRRSAGCRHDDGGFSLKGVVKLIGAPKWGIPDYYIGILTTDIIIGIYFTCDKIILTISRSSLHHVLAGAPVETHYSWVDRMEGA